MKAALWIIGLVIVVGGAGVLWHFNTSRNDAMVAKEDATMMQKDAPVKDESMATSSMSDADMMKKDDSTMSSGAMKNEGDSMMKKDGAMSQ